MNINSEFRIRPEIKGQGKGWAMYHILASLLFAAALAVAIAVLAVTVAAYKEKAIAALMMRPLRRPHAPWRTPPRRSVRRLPGAITAPRLSRAAA